MSERARPVERRFAQLAVGDEASFEVVVAPELVQHFAALSGDWNPLHVDESWSAGTTFGGRIAHGMLLAGLFSRLVGMHLPGAYSVYVGQDIRFQRPVRPGERVTVRGRITALSPATRVATLRTWITNAGGETVLDGEAKVMVQDPATEAREPMDPVALDLSREVVVVTGSSRGIGAATAQLLARHGAAVVIDYLRHRDRAEELVNDISASGGRSLAVSADVADADAVAELFAKAREAFGPVTALVNNASGDVQPRPFADMTWADFQRDIDVVVRGAVLCSQAALPDFQAAGRGAIVNVVSTFALGAPPDKLSRYVTAKAALLGLTRALAVELGPRGVRVNAVAPGVTETDLTAHLPARVKDLYAYQTPLRRNARPADVARAVLFLLSPAASFLNGAVIPVCGGQVMLP